MNPGTRVFSPAVPNTLISGENTIGVLDVPRIPPQRREKWDNIHILFFKKCAGVQK